MPLVEQELLILPEKMSSPKVLMGGGGKSPLSYRSASWTDISRASGILKGPVVQKFYWPYGPVNFFSYVDPCNRFNTSDFHLFFGLKKLLYLL
jgi:hypothetical protein